MKCERFLTSHLPQILYESHSVLHGRPYPLKGRFMANVFVYVCTTLSYLVEDHVLTLSSVMQTL